MPPVQVLVTVQNKVYFLRGDYANAEITNVPGINNRAGIIIDVWELALLLFTDVVYKNTTR